MRAHRGRYDLGANAIVVDHHQLPNDNTEGRHPNPSTRQAHPNSAPQEHFRMSTSISDEDARRNVKVNGNNSGYLFLPYNLERRCSMEKQLLKLCLIADPDKPDRRDPSSPQFTPHFLFCPALLRHQHLDSMIQLLQAREPIPSLPDGSSSSFLRCRHGQKFSYSAGKETPNESKTCVHLPQIQNKQHQP
ncbi:uncharacterized protein FOMMEDRAFT_159125 [Fomitiporia mediterranea MF3/22]|uniref:uncharacterized protein n=1 Tax=Fomitiporia mediterranea (strain MF3/22) TaxID=694068 RepID=UPI0004408199|nr:uncharacterized protein FOMMEDRAFT_159125 [Fomitiporia mediterranea MF3/22]EJD00439.1 hypothetical protein FOMMEDRAFT_159125 [Fomitiporia mediterranea MF3/22]